MIPSIRMAGYGQNPASIRRNTEGKVAFAGSDPLEEILLKNGTREPKATVTVTRLALDRLKSEGLQGVLALYDLASRAKDPSYQFFGGNQQKLQDLGLVQPDGSIHDSIRNIVLSSVKGDGLDMEFVDPVQQ